jgi:hypothetical protein
MRKNEEQIGKIPKNEQTKKPIKKKYEISEKKICKIKI